MTKVSTALFYANIASYLWCLLSWVVNLQCFTHCTLTNLFCIKVSFSSLLSNENVQLNISWHVRVVFTFVSHTHTGGCWASPHWLPHKSRGMAQPPCCEVTVITAGHVALTVITVAGHWYWLPDLCAPPPGWKWYYRRYIDVKKGGVGGLGMLLAGYCVLSYVWSYPHLSKWGDGLMAFKGLTVWSMTDCFLCVHVFVQSSIAGRSTTEVEGWRFCAAAFTYEDWTNELDAQPQWNFPFSWPICTWKKVFFNTKRAEDMNQLDYIY